MSIEQIGSDAEVILVDPTGQPLSAIGLFNGTKTEPEWHDEFNTQHDGPLCEFAVNPSDSKIDFIDKIKKARHHVEKVAKSSSKLLSRASTGVYMSSEMKTKEAYELGCMPSLNAWSLNEYKADTEGFKHHGLSEFFRSAGAHVHVSWTGANHESEDGFEHTVNFGRWLDVSLGAWSVLVDTDRLRRRLYGQAGDIRPKEYGLEYRSLSNFWIFNDNHVAEVWDRVHYAYDRSRKQLLHEVIDPNILIEGINSYDESKCKQILRGRNLL